MTAESLLSGDLIWVASVTAKRVYAKFGTSLMRLLLPRDMCA